MGRLGTETAFEVLARARALERQGKDDRPPRDRRAGLRHAGAHPRGGQAGARRGRDALRPVGRAARAARGDRRAHREDARHPGRARRGRGDAGGQAHHVLRDHGAREPGRRGDLPEPRLPHLRVGDQLRGREAGADPAPRGDRLRLRPARSSSGASRSKTKLIIINSPENPTGGVLAPEDARPHRRDRAPLPRARCCPTRSTGASSTTGEFASIASLPGMKTSDHHPGRLLEVLRDDRLAPRLRRDAEAARRARHAAHDELRLLHRVLHPAGGHRRAPGRRHARCRRWWRSSASGAT